MPSPTDASVRRFLRRSMVVEVATLSAKGHPFVTPLWFVVDGGALYLTTGPETRAGRNVVGHPQVTLLFHGERRVLRMRGTGTCHRGVPSWRVLLRAAAKYYVGPRALPGELRNASRWTLRWRYYGQLKGGLGYLRVVPGAAALLPRP
jgi:hypothetical protein